MYSSLEADSGTGSFISAAKAVVAKPRHKQMDRINARMRFVIWKAPFIFIYNIGKYFQLPVLFQPAKWT